MIRVGDTLPDGVLYFIDQERVLQVRSIRSLFAGKRAVMIGVAGAFTPTCSEEVPSLMALAPLLKAKGVTQIYCLAVNDAFVLKAWADSYKKTAGNQHVAFLADGSCTYTKALGLDVELADYGSRARRFLLFVDNMVVRIASVEMGEDKLMTAEQLLQRFI